MPAKGSRSSSKKAKKTGSNVFDLFSQKQVAEYKEGFQIMDHDRDGVITKDDLRKTFDEIGRVASEKELDEMLNEAPGPLNFTTMLAMFAARNPSGGEQDDDDVVAAAFRAFETAPGIIDHEKFRLMLTNFGDKFTNKEVDEAYEQFDTYDDDNIDSDKLIAMLCAGGGDDAEA